MTERKSPPDGKKKTEACPSDLWGYEVKGGWERCQGQERDQKTLSSSLQSLGGHQVTYTSRKVWVAPRTRRLLVPPWPNPEGCPVPPEAGSHSVPSSSLADPSRSAPPGCEDLKHYRPTWEGTSGQGEIQKWAYLPGRSGTNTQDSWKLKKIRQRRTMN